MFGSLRHMRSAAAAALAAFVVAGCAAQSVTPTTSPAFAPVAMTAQRDRHALRDDDGRIVPGAHVMLPRTGESDGSPFFLPMGKITNLSYHNGPVQTNPSIYVVFWGFTSDPDNVAPLLTKYLKAIGASTWLDTVTQYYESGQKHVTNPHGQLQGTWYDNSNAVPAHPTSAQVGAEAVRLAQHFRVYDPNAAYIVATPTQHSTARFGKDFCAFHDQTRAGGANIAYTDFPYMPDAGFSCGANSIKQGAAGKAEGVTIVGGHELAETQTDPFSLNGSGWWDNATGDEIADKCSWVRIRSTDFGTYGTFVTQPLWSNADHACTQAF